MRYRVIFVLLIVSLLQCREITPLFRLETSGLVSDFVLDGNRLYAATDSGSVDIFDLKSRKVIDRIVLDLVPTAKGDKVPARIYSIDRYQGKTLMVSRGATGYRNVWIHQGYRLEKIIDEKKKLFPKKARFIDDDRILFATFGSDIILYERRENYEAYHSHVSDSTLGDIALDSGKRKMVVSDECGTVRVIDVESSNTEASYNRENLDNIYKVAYRKGVILTAGQDRKVGVYLPDGKSYHIKSDFLVYCVALSPSGKTGIYSDGVDHDLQIFDTYSFHNNPSYLTCTYS